MAKRFIENRYERKSIAMSTESVTTTIRPPARAGQFYPGDVAQMDAMITRFLAADGPAQPHAPYRAIMLPHAGWVYCGETLGKTLARATLPDTLIIVGPKHTPYGPIASISSHDKWSIPGGEIPVATDLVAKLCEKIRGLSREPEAHKIEHAIEVLLPFLRHVNPNIRVVPIVLGGITFDDACAVGRALSRLVREEEAAGRKVMLVISSDMNHFASDTEGRRRDKLALDAMQTGDPRKLFETCVGNQISMCGVLPAVAIMTALREAAPIAPELVDYTTSAKASGDTSRVVGYAGVVIP